MEIKETTPFEINLNNFIPSGERVINSRPWGIVARYRSGIDELAKQDRKIVIVIPKEIDFVKSLFLEQFLGNVVLSLKEEGFKKKITFRTDGRCKIDNDLSEAIGIIMHKSQIRKSHLRHRTTNLHSELF